MYCSLSRSFSSWHENVSLYSCGMFVSKRISCWKWNFHASLQKENKFNFIWIYSIIFKTHFLQSNLKCVHCKLAPLHVHSLWHTQFWHFTQTHTHAHYHTLTSSSSSNSALTVWLSNKIYILCTQALLQFFIKTKNRSSVFNLFVCALYLHINSITWKFHGIEHKSLSF